MASPDKERFEIDGLTVESQVIETYSGHDGSKVARIETVCHGRSQITHHSDYGQDEGFIGRLKDAQELVARQFVKEVRGVAPEPRVFQGVQIEVPSTGKWSSVLVAAVDEDLPCSLLQASVIDALELEAIGVHRFLNQQTAGWEEATTYRAKIKLGPDLYDATFARANVQIPCVLGGDIISLVKAKGSKEFYQILDNDLDRAYRNAVRSKRNTVLIIGSFKKADREQLESARELLFARGYRGIMIDDFKDMGEQTLEEKLIFFASLCSFVLCIDVSPAGHYVELTTCARTGFVTAIVLGRGNHSTTAMIADLELRNRFMKFFEAASSGDLAESIDEIVTWASAASREKVTQLDRLYGWRAGNN